MSRTPPSPPAERRLDDAALRAHPLPDDGEADKHRRGTVLVVGGSARTPGAVILAGRAALRIGAGRLQLVTSPDVATAVAVAVPESMTAPFAALTDLVADADAVVVGPGLADPDTARLLVDTVVANVTPNAVVVFDALAIGVAADEPAGLRQLDARVVLTPNHQELDQLVPDTATDPATPCLPERAAATCHGVAIISFGCVATTDGSIWSDPAPVAGLGTSVAGDVLAGLAGGVGARSHDATTSALWASVVHRHAARRLASRMGRTGYLASEIADEVPAILETLTTTRATVEGAEELVEVTE
jgi:ADP-dependent NAD(P)H-hydrate dehydratase